MPFFKEQRKPIPIEKDFAQEIMEKQIAPYLKENASQTNIEEIGENILAKTLESHPSLDSSRLGLELSKRIVEQRLQSESDAAQSIASEQLKIIESMLEALDKAPKDANRDTFLKDKETKSTDSLDKLLEDMGSESSDSLDTILRVLNDEDESLPQKGFSFG